MITYIVAIPALNTAAVAQIRARTSRRSCASGMRGRVSTTKANASSRISSVTLTAPMTRRDPNWRVSMPATTDPTIAVMPATDTTLPAWPSVNPAAVRKVVVQLRMP